MSNDEIRERANVRKDRQKRSRSRRKVMAAVIIGVISLLFMIFVVALNPDKEMHIKEFMLPAKRGFFKSLHGQKVGFFDSIMVGLFQNDTYNDLMYQQIDYHNRIFYSYTTHRPSGRVMTYGWLGQVRINIDRY